MLNFDYKTFCKTIPHKSGVYQMFDEKNKLLYVGKAKDLRKRVTSYFLNKNHTLRIHNLVAQIADIKIIITNNESEALLLEYNLIKNSKPYYNILLKDDKSYPYLLLSEHDFPALSSYRGAKTQHGIYFGPFVNGKAIYETKMLLQKIFKLRQCSDHVFKSRSRPCLQYQIGRCFAPCVGLINQEEYSRYVDFVKLFLQGKNADLVHNIEKLMIQEAKSLNFNQAGIYRDQLTSLKHVTQQQCIISSSNVNLDVLAIIIKNQFVIIDILFVRNGLVLGNKSYVHEIDCELIALNDFVTTFIIQYYAKSYAKPNINFILPQKIMLNIQFTPQEYNAIHDVIFTLTQQDVQIIKHTTKQTLYKQWMSLAIANAENNLMQKLTQHVDLTVIFHELQRELFLLTEIQYIECFDVSHHGGEATVVSQVVFDVNGEVKDKYRRYNVKYAKSSDDYGALREILSRRFAVCDSVPLAYIPDVLIIDGGKGQLDIAREVLSNIKNQEVLKTMTLLSIAKGDGRKRGAETIYFWHNETLLTLLLSQIAFNFLLRIRDEAHRFAITGQRKKMRKQRI